MINPKKYRLAEAIEDAFGKAKPRISPFAHISEEAKIGKNITIDDGVVVYPATIIRDNVVIKANAVLGVPGMNYAANEEGEVKRIKHLSELIVEDDVFIGSLTTVQRGTFKPTIIGKGSGVGPNCDVGHQAKIGRYVVIASMSFIGGHAEIGDYTYIGAHSTIKNGVKIGKRCFVGIGSLVLRDVPDGQTVVGRPAIELEEFKRQRKLLKEFLQQPSL